MNWHKQLHWLIYPLFALACARQTTPTGGPKDSIPPSLTESNPKSGQINYTKQTVDLTFDESIILNNPKEQIIITPDLGKDFKTEVKKNKLSIQFEKTLEPNTTYSINFRDAVQDITEKNPVPNLKIAFSTGDYIDSLTIQGEVYDLQKSTPLKDATVSLYKSDTFNIFKHKPTYITKTDATGKFQIENLKPDIYRIYAINDKNKNLVVESKSEAFGFLSKPIKLDSNINALAIPTIRLDTRPLTLTSARPYGTMFVIKASKPINNYSFTSKEKIPSSLTSDKSSINIYNTGSPEDSIQVQLQAADSISNSLDTTLYVKFSKREAKPEQFEVIADGFKVIGPKGIISGKISFSKPLLSINLDSILYQVDSATSINITLNDITLDTITHVLHIHKEFDKSLLVKKPQRPDSSARTRKNLTKEELLKRGSKPQQPDYQFYIAAKTFISIESDTSKQIKIPSKPTTLENTGIIMVELKTVEDNPIIELLAKNSKVISTSKYVKKATFEDLEPADYQIRVIVDKNKNGKWDPGNFFLNQEPEQITYYKNEKGQTNVTLKANWELGPLLITH